MKPDSRFLKCGKDFWAHVRLISQHVGYTAAHHRRRQRGKQARASVVKVPDRDDIATALQRAGLSTSHVVRQTTGSPTRYGQRLLAYFKHRASALNDHVEKQLMHSDEAGNLFEQLKGRLRPKCPLPMNKQRGDKKMPAFFTGIVNMLIETNSQGWPCDYDPRVLTMITRNNRPFRTLARRVDGAFPGPVDPVAVWEIKEYYYTTTFGSRVADGVYESLLDGMELEELRARGEHIKHYQALPDGGWILHVVGVRPIVPLPDR